MTEITLKLREPAKVIQRLRHAAEVVDACAPLAILADSIEEQVKPAVEEPTEFGSIVEARWSSQPKEFRKLRWQNTPLKGKHYWESETGIVEVWSELTDVEVLRVGLGNTDEDKLAAAFRDGLHEGLRQNQGARFCTRSQNCRMAEGHEGGCQP